MFVPVEPDADFGGAHVQVQLELRDTVFAGLLLAFDDEEKCILRLLVGLEDGNVDGV